LQELISQTKNDLDTKINTVGKDVSSVETKYDGLRDKLEESHDDLQKLIETTKNDLTTNIIALGRDVSSIEATIRSAKLIGVAAVVVAAILSALGISRVANQLQTLETSLATAKTVSHEYAIITQRDIAGAIDAEFDKSESLDALRNEKEIRDKIKELSASLRAVATKLDTSDASTEAHPVVPG
jgi:hypothetical protein